MSAPRAGRTPRCKCGAKLWTSREVNAARCSACAAQSAKDRRSRYVANAAAARERMARRIVEHVGAGKIAHLLTLVGSFASWRLTMRVRDLAEETLAAEARTF